MSELGEMIKRLCPNGVEYKKLGEVAELKRGVRVVRSQLSEGGTIPVFQNSLKPLGYHTESNCLAKTAFVICAGAAGEVGFSDIPFWAADDCHYFICPENLNSRYLYYFLCTKREHLLSKVRKASIPRLAREFIENLSIPLPPLEIQSEIVKILDNFAELTAELTAELEKRKKQYEHYRDMLLNFEGGGINCEFSCEWKRLGEIAKIMRGKRLTKSDLSDDNPFPVFHGGLLPLGYYSQSNRDKDTVMIINVGASAGTVGYCKEQFWASDGCFCLSKNDIALSKYLYYALQSKELEIKGKVRVAGIPTLDSQAVASISIPLPPLAEQERIVAILDRFDSLCNSLTEGLPAEIALRKKQYEYYRDKLLSFGVASDSRSSSNSSLE